MRRAGALAALALMAAVTAAALLAPPAGAAALALGGVLLARSGRRPVVALLLVALPVNVLVLALATRGGAELRWGALALSLDGARLGLVGWLRLAAALAPNLAILSWLPPARLLEALRLPPRATALLAATLLAAHDVGRDFARLRDARELEGAWPRARLARAREAARLVPTLLVASHRRALLRRDALRLAGHDQPAWFVPVVAVAALAAAGRMALLALPNVALTYVVVFLGGMLYGARVAMLGGLLGMALTDFLLTGLYPLGFVNAPAMALLGLAGALLRRLDWEGAGASGRAAGLLLAASVGIAGTFAFSVATDLLTWMLAYRAPEALAPIVLAGLAFNVLPALVNGALFAAAVTPTLRAFRAAGWAPAGAPTMAPPAPDAPLPAGAPP